MEHGRIGHNCGVLHNPLQTDSLTRALLPALAAILLVACGRTPDASAPAPEIAAAPEYLCGRGGYLKTSLFGAISARIDWPATAVKCEGMPRPDARGARLRFAGHLAAIGQDVAVIVAMPDLVTGMTGNELKTNATIILEGSGRFFSTAADDVCWTDVLRQELLADERYAIGGKMYCIGPLIEVNGDAEISLTELEFSGLLDWSAK